MEILLLILILLTVTFGPGIFLLLGAGIYALGYGFCWVVKRGIHYGLIFLFLFLCAGVVVEQIMRFL